MAATATQQRASGYALVFGAPSADIKFSGGSTIVGYIIMGYDFERTADQVTTTDEEGKVVNNCRFNFGATCTLQVKFRGTDIAAAQTAALALAPGTQVQIVDPSATNSFTDDDLSDATTGKGWSLKSWTKTSAPGQQMSGTVVLERFDGISTYTATTS